MFSEIFGFLASAGKDIANSKKINLSNRRIKSISSFSSNSIFYFPIATSNQCQMDEVTMMQRALEKQYASFIVACISQIPFHRVSSSNAFAVDEYLKQFHQNMGVSPGSDVFAKAYNAASMAGIKLPIEEGATFVPGSQTDIENYFARIWNESVENDQDYVTYLVENYISLNDMYNESATDPYVKALSKTYRNRLDELNLWGFIGPNPSAAVTEACDELGYEPQVEEGDSDPDVADAPLEEPESAEPGQLVTESANPVDQVKFTLESITDNKIRSCKNRSKLRSIESKLKGLKKKYTAYLVRYKKRYEENEKEGTKKKLIIRFNKETIADPKAFMKEYGSYMKIINRKLKLCEERREELLNRAGKTITANETASVEMSYADYTVLEAAMSAKERNNIDTSLFGLPEKRKYPLNDAKHVRLAVQMSSHVANDKEAKELAKNIVKRCKELNIDITVSKKNKLYEYVPKSMQESTEVDVLNDLTEMDETALDKLIESIDTDLNASDKEVFTLVEAPDYDDYNDLYQRYQTEKDRNARLSDALKNRQSADRSNRSSRATGSNMGNRLDMSRRTGKQNDYDVKTFDREVFTKMDMQKCNEMVPTFTKATIGFIVDETEEVVNKDLLIGIKAQVHRVDTMDMVNAIYNAIISKRGFLKFVKFISGEERSLADLMLGIKELKDDALKAKSSNNRWASAFKHRKRLSKLSIPFIMNNYLPNGTIIMTMNEVEYIKANYGVDVMRADHCKMIMDTNFLLGFVILDQANEIAYVMYDGINGGQFAQYGYAALERDQQRSDRDMKELFRIMNK